MGTFRYCCMNFTELGLDERVLEAISYMNYTTATPIQEQAVPHILQGKDLIACAQTGTGKTAAFTLPVLDRLVNYPEAKTRVLILVPTRELAVQIQEQIQGFSYFTDVHSATVYGGGSGLDFDKEKFALRNGTDIIVATPGKLISHISLGNANFSDLEVLILDEADRMLDMGFHDDIMRIVKALPEKRQTLMFSATMAPKIRQLARALLQSPEEITLAVGKPAEGVTQLAYAAHDGQKNILLNHIIKQFPEAQSILVFSSTRRKVMDILKGLRRFQHKVEFISSDLEQKQREEVLGRFRSRATRVLVATDVLSRGIDIKDIDLVINYDVPNAPEDYVHRIGRTARAQSKGAAATLINQADQHKWKRIVRLIEREFPMEPLPDFIAEIPAPKDDGKKKTTGNRSGKRTFNKRNSNGPSKS